MHHIGVIFGGGPDDRDALAFASYMASGESVTVHSYIQIGNGKSEEDTRMDNEISS